MKVLRFVFSVFLISLSVSAFADDTLSLSEALKPFVKHLNRSIYTYHYVTREAVKVPTSGVLDPKDPKLANHVHDWATFYWDLSQPGGTGMIRGLYLASDPVASRDFGKDRWLLYRVELTSGLNYLDMINLESAQRDIPPSLVPKLKAQGCDETRWNYLIYKSFDKGCREIALQTLKDLDITFIDYSWATADFPPCTKRPADTFILLRPERLSGDSVRVFYSESPHSDVDQTEEQRMLETFFLHVKPNAGHSGSTAPETDPEKYKLWPELDSNKATDGEFQNYLRSHIIGCELLVAK